MSRSPSSRSTRKAGTRWLAALALLAACHGEDTGATLAASSTLVMPRLPWAGGMGAEAPWGGDPAKWRSETVLANAMSEAMNAAYARAGTIDAIVAIPVKMKISAFNQFGDGQLNSAPTLTEWNKANGGRAQRPPLIATLVSASTGAHPLVVAFDVESAALPAASPMRQITIRYVDDGGATRVDTVALPAGPAGARLSVDWPLPTGLTLGAPLLPKTLLVSLDAGASWYPVWFRFPIRTDADLAASVPNGFRKYTDGRSLIDREGVSSIGATDGSFPFARLDRGDPATRFSTPFVHFINPGIHNLYPPDPAHPEIKEVVAVGRSWNWTPFAAGRPLVQPFHIHYLCVDQRQAAAEAAAPNGGVVTGAGWHRVDMAGETYLNDLENGPLLTGQAQANPFADPLPSGAYAFGLADVMAFRFVRPGEAFVTIASGTTINSTGAVIDQSTFHAVFAFAEHPSCVEVWVHPCAPEASRADMSCAATPTAVHVAQVSIAAGERLFLKPVARFVLNVPSKPSVVSDAFSTPDSRGALVPLAPLAGSPDFGATLSLPQAMLVDYQVVKQDASGHELARSPLKTFPVPVAKAATLLITKPLP